MDLTTPNYYEPPSLFPSHGAASLEGNNGFYEEASLEGNNGFYKASKENPFVDAFPDPLCKLNLKETSEFVKAFPMGSNGGESRGFLEASAQRRREGSVTKRNPEAPPTPGRPIFSFSVGNFSRKNFPSKWDDAEKWLINGHDSPAPHHHHHHHPHGLLKPSESSKGSKQCSNNGVRSQATEVIAEKCRLTEEKVSKTVFLDHHNSGRPFNGVSVSADVLLKDKFTNEVEPIFPKLRCLETMKDGFLFGNSADKSAKDAPMEVVDEVKHRDIGTEMTPLGSSTTSRCHTPFKSSSPARHNTPANRSGPLALTNYDSANSTIDIAQLQECHLAKLNLGTQFQFDSVTSNWSSREEEEEDISKSLRHSEMSNECRKSVSDSRACAWEEEEKTKCCLRYKREEAKIQAWVNLQNAKAEAQSKKLEVQIERMRSKLEEKLMKRMAIVHRKAEELRAAAQLQHSNQTQRTTQQARNMHFSLHTSCGCFPCCNNIHH